MENKLAALQKSEAFKSMKGKLLGSLGEDIGPLLIEGLKYSLHPTLTDAVLELSRSELLFVALLQALFSQNTVMSGRLLVAAEDWLLLPRISGYMGGKLMVEFNCTTEFMSRALEFAKKLKTSGLIKVPRKMLKYLSYLTEIVRKEEIEAREQALRRQAVQKESASTPSPATTSMANEDQIAPTTSNPPTQSAVASISRPQIAQGSTAPPMQSAAAPPMRSAAVPPMQSAAASISRPQIAQGSTAPPMQSAAAPPMRSAAVPPMQSAAASTSYLSEAFLTSAGPVVRFAAASTSSRPQIAPTTTTSPMQSAVASTSSQPQITLTTAGPFIQSAAASTSYLSEAGTSGGSQEAGGQENQGAISRRAISRGQKRRRTSDTQDEPTTSQGSQTPQDQVLRENATLALFAAVQNNDPEATRDTIVNGACIDRRNANGFTPLHVAAGMGHLKAMAVLLKRGADTEVVDSAGDRPLHTAADNRMAKAVALLRAAGADINARDQRGLTPALRATGLFVEAKRKICHGYADAVRRNGLQAVRAAIENGANIEERRDITDWTALAMAAFYDHVEVMSVLLRAGGNKDAVNSYSIRPLHWACLLWVRWSCGPVCCSRG